MYSAVLAFWAIAFIVPLALVHGMLLGIKKMVDISSGHVLIAGAADREPDAYFNNLLIRIYFVQLASFRKTKQISCVRVRLIYCRGWSNLPL